jgi:hypothetical protein
MIPSAAVGSSVPTPIRSQGGFILGFLVGPTPETIPNSRFKIQKGGQ